MTEHTHSVVVPGCFRCELGKDEENAALAEEYWEENIEPSLEKVGTPEGGIRFLRRNYIEYAMNNAEAVKQLHEWWEARDE